MRSLFHNIACLHLLFKDIVAVLGGKNRMFPMVSVSPYYVKTE